MHKKTSTVILGKKISIEHVDNLVITEGIYGDACDTDYVIRIDAGLTGAKYKRVLRHEKTHIALRLSGLVELMDDELEEALCRLMETFTP